MRKKIASNYVISSNKTQTKSRSRKREKKIVSKRPGRSFWKGTAPGKTLL